VNAAARAAVTLAAVVASFATMTVLCDAAGAQRGPAIAAAILAVGFARRADGARDATPVLGALRLVAVALIASAVGALLRALPIAGAIIFVAVLAGSVWLRAFGARGRAISTLLALPMVALLVVPFGPAHARGGAAVDLALGVAVGLVAFGWSEIAGALMRRFDVPSAVDAARPSSAPTERKRRPGLSVPARMAIQLAVALAAAFAIGGIAFPGHAGWAVLTAFIVCGGARGRGDALYTAVLRLGGALAGIVIAAAVSALRLPDGIAEAVVIFGALYLGLWLRERNYAFWAAAMTLIFALLSRTGDALAPALLAVRLEAILVGAVCGAAAAWFIVPIRTESVVRRYLADALLAFDDYVAHVLADPDERAARLARFEGCLADLARVAPPLRWHRRALAARAHANHPAGWIDRAHALRAHLSALADRSDHPAIRRAIGVSRRAIGTHGAAEPQPDHLPIATALDALHALLDRPERAP